MPITGKDTTFTRTIFGQTTVCQNNVHNKGASES